MYNQIWYVEGLVDYLNNLGYVHFVTKDALDEDFETGAAFYYDTEKKEYGRLESVTGSGIEEASKLRDEMSAAISKAKGVRNEQ